MNNNNGRPARNNPPSDDEDDFESDLTLRLSLGGTEPQDPPPLIEHDFMGLGTGGSSNHMVHYGDMVGSSPYEGNAAGILTGGSLRPIATNEHHQSALAGGSLPWTGYATPSRKRPTHNEAKMCANCNATISPSWRRGSAGEILCNKCGLKHSRSLKKASK